MKKVTIDDSGDAYQTKEDARDNLIDSVKNSESQFRETHQKLHPTLGSDKVETLPNETESPRKDLQPLDVPPKPSISPSP